jgi:hypothetical protein
MAYMKNYSVSEKSKGILAFANNSPTVDYERIANKTLQLASRSLGLPVHLVVGQKQDHWRNTRYDVDQKKTVVWNNFNRYEAWEQTPFEQTLVIDVDYLITTQRLLGLFDGPQDLILCHKNEMLLEPTLDVTALTPVWATVFYFRKTPRTRLFFELVGRIQRNWEYYRVLFGIAELRFRNDYAFAMAEIIIGGYNRSSATNMPFGIVTADNAITDIQINNNWMTVRTSDNATVLPRTDLHVMSKAWLQSNKLEKFICEA